MHYFIYKYILQKTPHLNSSLINNQSNGSAVRFRALEPGQRVIADMGRSGTAPFAQLLGECFHCQSFSAGNGVVMLSAEDAAEADAKEE